jgi:cholest-4-en-3-one 26-monooxygenase
MPTPNLPAGFDLLDPDVTVKRLPVAELAELRSSQPIYWVDVPDGTGGFGDKGYWAITKHKDVKEISVRSDVFSSQQDCAIPVWPQEMTREQIDLQRNVMLNMDAPHHTRLRKIISRGFTPRAIGRLRDELDSRAQNIAKAAAAAGTGDFVEQVSCELPLQAIADLLGVPQDDRDKIFRWSNEMTGNEDPEYAHIDPAMSSAELIMYAMKMAEERAKNPGDDIVTKLIEADIEGEKLSDDEFGMFVVMLAVAGNETTRNSITHGMIAFSENPDQWELFKKERPDTAPDEIVRWATPVTAFQRTALEDYELSGVQIKKGQRVVMFYRSANFDDEVFDEPDKFDIMRNPNPHVGFGGTGAHYCVGANLAKMTISLIFNAVADNMPDLKPISTPERLR